MIEIIEYEKIIEKYIKEDEVHIVGNFIISKKNNGVAVPFPQVLPPWDFLQRQGFPLQLIEDIKNKRIRRKDNIEKAEKFVKKIIESWEIDYTDIITYTNSLIRISKKIDRRLLILGTAGAGKTTAIAYICYRLYKINPFINTTYLTLYNVSEFSIEDIVSSSILILDNLDVFKTSMENTLYDMLSLEDKKKITSSILYMYDKGRCVIMSVNDTNPESTKEILRRIGNESLAQRFENVINLGDTSIRLEKRETSLK